MQSFLALLVYYLVPFPRQSELLTENRELYKPFSNYHAYLHQFWAEPLKMWLIMGNHHRWTCLFWIVCDVTLLYIVERQRYSWRNMEH